MERSALADATAAAALSPANRPVAALSPAVRPDSRRGTLAAELSPRALRAAQAAAGPAPGPSAAAASGAGRPETPDSSPGRRVLSPTAKRDRSTLPLVNSVGVSPAWR